MKPPKASKAFAGPLKNKDGIAFDYIVIIDSGSKGSRVYVYNWLNPQQALEKQVNLNNYKNFKDFKLVERFDVETHIEEKKTGEESDLDSDDDSTSKEDKKKSKKKNKSGKGKGGDKHKVKLPKINGKIKWSSRIKPGVSTFNGSPQKIGNHHLKHLMALASKVVPKSQQYRTPIFLHSTAGMRLLNPTEQQKILDNICTYFQRNSDFFLPDCPSHVNVIDGDVEGLYGWLAINYMVGAFDDPNSHQHGKNHTTYGLLDMGGASTQIVFQPNTTEIEEHQNNLFKVSLHELPRMKEVSGTGESGNEPGGSRRSESAENSDKESENSDKEPENSDKESESSKIPPSDPIEAIGAYYKPQPLTFDVYSDSFLGMGMTQAYNKYLSNLVDNNPEDHGFFYTPPIPDPCLPRGYIGSVKVKDESYDFTGSSNFEQCLTSIFPVLSKSTYGSKVSGNCEQYSDGNKISSCLLNDLIPAFDFEVNHFYGVSGYWYAISKLMEYNDAPQKRKSSDTDYDYETIYANTKNICSKSYSELIELNDLKPELQRLDLNELANLCFKSSWILNFLHLGLGFPRFDIDEDNDKFKSLKLVDKVGGSEFSWTLGRALLYANDEYVQAFNNYTLTHKKDEELIERSGFYFSQAEGSFHYGSEQNDVLKRPDYIEPKRGTRYHYYDYEKNSDNYSELKWNIEPHRWYGIIIFGLLVGIIVFLLVGESGRKRFVERVKQKYQKVKEIFSNMRGGKYRKLEDVEMEDFVISESPEPGR